MAYKPFGAFRTFLALFVIVQHVGVVGPSEMGWGSWGTGSVAVLAFFCLSGYVITEAADRIYRGRAIEFASNRALRILPQYVFSLALSAGAIALVAYLKPEFVPHGGLSDATVAMIQPTNLISNLFFVLPGFGAHEPALIPYVWTLRVEVFFYLILTLVIWSETYNRTLSYSFLITVAVAMFAAAVFEKGPGLFQFVPFFGLGMLVYFAGQKRSVLIHVAIAGFFVSSLWTCLNITMPQAFPGKVLSAAQSMFQGALFSVFVLAFLCLANVKVSRRYAAIDGRIGDLSFPIYLQQHFILVLVAAFLKPSYFSVELVFILAILAAVLSDFVIEAPLRAVRDRVRGRTLKPDGPEVAARRDTA